MRRTILVLTATLAIAATATGVARAASPHFLKRQSDFRITQEASNGELSISWRVAGLGGGGTGWIVAKGTVDVVSTCGKNGGGTMYRSKTVQVNEHLVYADAYGNADGTDVLRPNALCPGGTTLRSATVAWTGISVELWSPSKATRWDRLTWSSTVSVTFP